MLSVQSNEDLIEDLFVVEDNELVLASDAADFDSEFYKVTLRVTDQSGEFYDRSFGFSFVPTITLSNDLLVEDLTPFSTVATIGSTTDDFGFNNK